MPKVEEFRALRDSELGDGSRRIAEDVLANFRDLGYLPLGKHAVPTYDGAVAIEWRSAGIEYTAQIHPGGRLFLCTDDTVSDELAETELAFDMGVLQKFLASGEWDPA